MVQTSILTFPSGLPLSSPQVLDDPASSQWVDAGASSSIYDPLTHAAEREPPFWNDEPEGAPLDLTGQALERGYIMEDFSDPSDRSKQLEGAIDWKKRYRFKFHYNPATINETWDVDLKDDVPERTIDGVPGVRAKGMTFSWVMLITRLRFNPKRPEGVMHDTRILNKILTQGYGGPDTANNALYAAPVKVVFGPGGQGSSNKWIRSPLGCFGNITSYSCQYERFNKLMVPVYATAAISVRVSFLNPSSAAATAPAAAGAASTRDTGIALSGAHTHSGKTRTGADFS